MKWNVSYNNEPEKTVDAESEKEAIAIRLKQLNLDAAEHPIRAWPKQEQEK